MQKTDGVVVVFRSRIRLDADLVAMERMGIHMYELASEMPGFVSYKEFTAADGESVAIVEFTDMASLAAWRNHPEHQEAQRQGRDIYMSDYDIKVCRTERAYSFRHGVGRT